MKTNNLLVFIFSVVAIASINNTYGFSIHKPVKDLDRYSTLKYLKVSELIKLSAKELGELTGKKMSVWDKASFAIAKIKMKHDLKKNSTLTIMDYFSSGPFFKTSSKVLNILYWVLIGLLLAILILFTAASKQH